jgi:hypothetical protein
VSQITHIELERKLFAVAVEIPIKRNGKVISWVPEITHVHANDSLQARAIYMQDSHHHNHRIVAIGPVIGYHVEDEHGEQLRA